METAFNLQQNVCTGKLQSINVPRPSSAATSSSSLGHNDQHRCVKSHAHTMHPSLVKKMNHIFILLLRHKADGVRGRGQEETLRKSSTGALLRILQREQGKQALYVYGSVCLIFLSFLFTWANIFASFYKLLQFFLFSDLESVFYTKCSTFRGSVGFGQVTDCCSRCNVVHIQEGECEMKGLYKKISQCEILKQSIQTIIAFVILSKGVWRWNFSNR